MSLLPATNEKRSFEQLLHYSNRPSSLSVMIEIFQNIASYQKRKGEGGGGGGWGQCSYQALDTTVRVRIAEG